MTDVALAEVDLSAHRLTPQCEMRDCEANATVVARGCMDKRPVLMCDRCFDRGIELVKTTVKMYMRLNKHVLICQDCNRPIINLETHLEVRRLPS